MAVIMRTQRENKILTMHVR